MPKRVPSTTPKRIPIAAAKRVAEEYGYEQVVILGRKCSEPSQEWSASYGVSPMHCHAAGIIAKALAERVVPALTRLKHEITDHEEAAASVRSLCRQIDVSLHGEEGAAKQASLCDLVGPIAEAAGKARALDEPRPGLNGLSLSDLSHLDLGHHGTGMPMSMDDLRALTCIGHIASARGVLEAREYTQDFLAKALSGAKALVQAITEKQNACLPPTSAPQ